MLSQKQLSQVVSLKHSFWRIVISVLTLSVILIEPGVSLYEWLTNRTPLMCLMQNVPRGSFRYGSSATWLQIFPQVDRNITSECPEFQLHFVHPPVRESGSDVGIKMLLNNQIDFAISSRRIKKEEYQEAKRKGFEIKNIPVALDGIAIAVHPNLPISGLSITQLKQILIGKITNWKQVGGTDLKITLYIRKPSSTFNFIEEDVLEGQPIRQDIEVVSSVAEGVKKVASDAGGIYLASAAYLGSQCTVKTLPVSNQLKKLLLPYQELSTFAAQCKERGKSNVPTLATGNYRLTRPLFVIVKQNGGSEQQAGEAYANILLTAPRQELIEKAGFLRIR